MSALSTPANGGGGRLSTGDNMIDVVYDPATGILTVDTTGAQMSSILIPGPEALTIDRWLNNTYQDGVFWMQQYYSDKEQWGGLMAAVPEGVYQIATYATGLEAEDFGEVEFCTLQRDILFTNVQIAGEGLRLEGFTPETSTSFRTSAQSSSTFALPPSALAVVSASADPSAAPPAVSWLYEYEPPSSARSSPLQTALLPSAVDQFMAAW